VPTMLVLMKSAEPVIDRSTWLSAARCMIRVGLNSAMAWTTAGRSQMSILAKRWFGAFSIVFSEARLPA
jgi:hypothetical protein